MKQYWEEANSWKQIRRNEIGWEIQWEKNV